ncbi:hypothetical protein B4U79_01499 [Dinothrombium tinctorium]|uniref:Uncharacterized protein n=1 Tax=Dinothrombium tinctorium TaxID=1965070 RepID=A0A3S3RZD8_9ACAR|nr:hypothetical protein B4U79_05684 [Dinothrombium tinctorium]RWS08276.1 hypothetical protein B4U79_01499 [Dinothrombium tinctorium]
MSLVAKSSLVQNNSDISTTVRIAQNILSAYSVKRCTNLARVVFTFPLNCKLAIGPEMYYAKRVSVLSLSSSSFRFFPLHFDYSPFINHAK